MAGAAGQLEWRMDESVSARPRRGAPPQRKQRQQVRGPGDDGGRVGEQAGPVVADEHDSHAHAGLEAHGEGPGGPGGAPRRLGQARPQRVADPHRRRAGQAGDNHVAQACSGEQGQEQWGRCLKQEPAQAPAAGAAAAGWHECIAYSPLATRSLRAPGQAPAPRTRGLDAQPHHRHRHLWVWQQPAHQHHHLQRRHRRAAWTAR